MHIIACIELNQAESICHVARILRGLRIAARLGLSFSKKTETAMHDLSPSIKSLGKVLTLEF